MGFRLAAFDMDGTLLTNQHTITENTKNKIKQLQDLGISIALISGRNKNNLLQYAKELELEKNNNFLSCLNGTEIYSFKEDKTIRETSLSNKDVNQLLDYTKKHHFRSIIYRKDDYIQNLRFLDYIALKARALIAHIGLSTGYEGTMQKTTFHFSFNYQEYKPVDKYVLLTRKDISTTEISKIKNDLSNYEVCVVAKGWIEITPKGINKGNSINKIANLIDCEITEVIAFGDSENDISMFQEIKYSIAMENALDVIKNLAYDITDTNQNDGVAKALDKYILKPIKQEKDIITNPLVEVVVDRQIGYTDTYGNVYPINYGYIRGLYGGDGEEQDAYIIDSSINQPIENYQGNVIAIIKRNDDVETKWVVSSQQLTLQEIKEQVHFLEQFFDSEILLL